VAPRPTLFYKNTCGPCGWMSRLAVVLSLGVIRRQPIDSAAAKALYARYPEHDGQLVLADGDRVTFGRRVFAEVPRVIVAAPFQLAGAVAAAAKAGPR
jgi:hypothetical protein